MLGVIERWVSANAIAVTQNQRGKNREEEYFLTTFGLKRSSIPCSKSEELEAWQIDVGCSPCTFQMDIDYQEELIRSRRGVQLFTCRWLPAFPPKALVFLCHGYGMECSRFMRGGGRRLASAGFGVFGMDYEGHGRSKGARCYIQKFSNIVNDCDDFFKSICAMEEYGEKPRFLYGESMGGAVALLLHRKDPSFWNGAVLVAPMCKISEEVKPHPVVINLLTTVEELIPKWKIVPAKDVIDSAFKDPVKREEIRNNNLIYQDKPRLKTALEMLRTSINLEKRMNEDDTVTDPGVSIELYETASSTDKTLKIYPGMWHGLTSGEPDSNIDMVFADIVAWLESHTVLYPMPGTPAHAIVNQSSNWAGQSGFKNGPSGRRSSRPHGRGSILCGLKGRTVHHTH